MDSIDISVRDGLTLRSWQLTEAADLFSLVDGNRAHLQQWLSWVPQVSTVADSEDFIRRSIEEREKNEGCELGIWYHDSLAGCIGLHELNRVHKKTSIGYWLGTRFVGKGLMTNAVKALTTYCFTTLELNRVEIRCCPENEKSLAIPRRLWFKKEGTLRQAELVNGEFLDNTVFSMLKKDWLTSTV